MNMKKCLFLSGVLGTVIAFNQTAYAEAEPAATIEPTPSYTIDYNLGLYSNYMFRGTALSDGPALQGGIDLTHNSGFYVGTWFSNIDTNYAGRGDGFSDGNRWEVDLYGGYLHTFDNGIGLNFLGNYYGYPQGEHSYNEANKGHKQDTFEASVGISYQGLTYTYYRALTDYYGADNNNGTKSRDTKGADYNEIKFKYKLPVADLNLDAKVGYQNTRHLNGDQGDFLIGLNRDFSLPLGSKAIDGFNAGGYFTSTFDVQDESYYVAADGRDVNKNRLTLFVKRTW
ncbi:MAG: TorF family putative porin [Methylophilaceae bacterium]